MKSPAMNHLAIFISGLLLTIAVVSPAAAQPRLPHTPMDKEILLLPEECKILLQGTQEQKKVVFTKNFPGFIGPNHYCLGLNFMNRAKFSSANKQEKQFNLQSAIGEFGYVLRHTPPTTPGLEQVKTQVQLARMMLKTR